MKWRLGVRGRRLVLDQMHLVMYIWTARCCILHHEEAAVQFFFAYGPSVGAAFFAPDGPKVRYFYIWTIYWRCSYYVKLLIVHHETGMLKMSIRSCSASPNILTVYFLFVISIVR